jgi:hypothetical protein
MQPRAVFVSQIKLVGPAIKRELNGADVLSRFTSQIVDQRDDGFPRHGESTSSVPY